jgi:hypothetical protein
MLFDSYGLIMTHSRVVNLFSGKLLRSVGQLGFEYSH